MLELKNDILFINGEPFEGDISVKLIEKNLFYLKIESIETGQDLLQFSFDDFKNVSTIKLPIITKWLRALRSITIFKIDAKFYTAFNYDIKILVTEIKNLLDYYSQLFRFVEIYRKENFIFQLSGLRIKKIEDLNFQKLNKGFSVVFEVQNSKAKIKDVLALNRQLLEEWNAQIEFNSSDPVDNSLKTFFKFPDEVKTSCEQYLIYFAQFLQDLGINATSNLKEEAGKVLFSVTPTDDVEALDKIREALAVYLNLPSSPIVYDESFAAMRLHQQIDNLQHSQRMIARELQFNEKLLVAQSEIIQEKNVTISQLQTNNEQQARIIEKITNPKIMMDSVENKEEFEKVFDGLEIGESKELKEKIGIKFNPITSLKTLGKKLIGDNNAITSLDLVEQGKAKNKRTDKIEEILKGVNKDNIHEEIEFGEPVGKEIIE